MSTPRRAADEIPVDAGTGRPAQRDARHAGPAHPAKRLTVTAQGHQRFTFDAAGASLTANPPAPGLDGSSIEELNHAAGVDCDHRTCASSGENESFNLNYVVDTLFDSLTTRKHHRTA